MALEHNLDVAIERLNPEIAKYNISYAYAGYDPTLRLGGQHNNSLSPGGYDEQLGLRYGGSKSESDSFSASLGGVLPTGLSYSLSGNTAETYGFNSGATGLFPYDNSTASAGITLTQPLLKNFWTDGTRTTIQLNKKALKASQYALRNQIISTIATVEQAYYTLVFDYENIKVQEEALELSKQLLKDNQRKVAVGTLAPLDEKQAQSQVASSEAALMTARLTLATQQNALKQLINDKFSSWDQVEIVPTTAMHAVPQAFSVQDSWHKGMTQRPDLLEYRIQLERQDITLRYQRNQLWPELDLVGSYGHRGAGVEFSDALGGVRQSDSPYYSYGAQIAIPLSNKAARTNYKIGKAQKQQMLLQMKKLEETVMVEIDSAVKTAQTSLQLIDATREARKYAEAALEAEQKKLESGKSTPFVVLQLQRDLTSARSAEISAVADYNKSLSRLSVADGSTLDRHNLSVVVK